MLKVYTVA